jgi:hypothetical protein
MLDQVLGGFSHRQSGDLRVERLHEASGLAIGIGEQGLPLRRFERGNREHRRRDRQPVGRETFEQAERQWQCSDRARCRCAKWLIDVRRLCSDDLKGLDDHRGRRIRAGARDQVDKLPPAHGRVVAVARGFIHYSGQAIVEPHLRCPVSFRRTRRRLYALGGPPLRQPV